MKKILIPPVGALAICVAISAPALAGDIAGTLSGSYANGSSNSGDLWDINGSVTGMLGANWGLEATGGYHYLSDNGYSGASLEIWNVGGSAFWRMTQGRLAATVNYYSTGLNIHVTNYSPNGQFYDADSAYVTSYGAGGEFYASPRLTVAVKGGVNSVDATSLGNYSGRYVGGMLQWYVIPNLSLRGSVDYADFSLANTTSETIKAEWLISRHIPISIYGGYEHISYGSNSIVGDGGDLFFVGLKFYMNGSGGETLVDRQRNGSLGYIVQAPVLGLSAE